MKNGCYNCGRAEATRNGKFTCCKKLGQKEGSYICFSWTPKKSKEEEMFIKGVILGSILDDKW